MESITKNPVQMKEVEAFRQSLKRGDKLIYLEEAPRDDGIKGRAIIKRVMEVDKVHKYTIDLGAGKLKRNVAIKVAYICNVRKHMAESDRKAREARCKMISDMERRGMTVEEISQQTGYSKCAVRNIQRANEDTVKKRDKRNAEIIRLRKAGKKVKEVAEQLGCSQNLVSGVYKRYMETEKNDVGKLS